MSFWITVYRNPDEEERNAENTLATWEGSLHRWGDVLDDLMKAGKLTQTRSDYFPTCTGGWRVTCCPSCLRIENPDTRSTSRPKCSRSASTNARPMLS